MASKRISEDNDAYERNRKRFIYLNMKRDPNGPILRRGCWPPGCRTPNLNIWGHTLLDIFWIERIPGIAYLTPWSTSMLQQLYDSLPPSQKEVLPTSEYHFPRVLQPWPLLCIPNDKGNLETLCLGGDEGCERGHDPGSTPDRVREVGDHLKAGLVRMRD